MGFIGNYLRNLGAVACGREPIRPLLVSWYCTHRCPRRCPHCSDGGGKPFAADACAELDTTQAKHFIGLLARDCDTLDFTGGEPALRTDLGELLAHARAVGMRTVLNTRAVDCDRRPDVLAHTDILVLGLDAIDPAVAGAACGADAQAGGELVAACHRLIALRATHGFRLAVSCVAAPGRFAHAAAVLDLACAHGLTFHCSPWMIGCAAHPGLRHDPEWPRLAERIRERRRQGCDIPGVDRYHRTLRDLAPYRCHPALMPTIRPDGRLYHPCLEMGRAPVDVVAAGGLLAALRAARRLEPATRCDRSCPIFCHAALSLLQRHPLAAIDELRRWQSTPRRIPC